MRFVTNKRSNLYLQTKEPWGRKIELVMLGQEKLVNAREKLKDIILKSEEEKLQGGGGVSFLEEFNIN